MKRREFLLRSAAVTGSTRLGIASAGSILSACARMSAGTASSEAQPANLAVGWERVPSILARIKAPSIPKRDFDITKFGAKAAAPNDNSLDSSSAITAAIAACAKAGGGRIVVPEGRFVTGPIHLQSKMELHVAKGATLVFVTDPLRYLPPVLTRFEGVECYNYSPLIYAVDATDVAVTGEGTLDGQADATTWWPWKGSDLFGWKTGMPMQVPARDKLFAMAESNAPVKERVMSTGSYLRPSFVQTYNCQNVLIEGVTIKRSPMWEIHPVLSRNVIVRNVHIDTHGPNNDGCDPESCTDVLIEGCTFDTGDDCIAIKSGRNGDGRRVNRPTENVIVRNCNMKDGHGGVTIGSEISGSVRYVYVDNCRMDSPELDRAIRLKTNARRGGTLEHIYVRDVTIGEVSDSVLSIDFTYEEGKNGTFMPTVRDIELRNVTSRKSKYGMYLRGFPQAPITNVRLESCRFDGVAQADMLENVTGIVRNNVTVNGKVVPS
ncbi:MAG: glycoside hydrolase family 28 protein [Gemmatimonadaceae bacterium]